MNTNTLTLYGPDNDRVALERLVTVDPVLTGVVPASSAIGLPGRWLLHAGPPVDLARIARPLLNSAVLAVLFEGWAGTAEDAEALILSGGVRLRPAQDHGAVVPLADVLSPSMQLLEVADARSPGNRCVTTINGGNGVGPDGPVTRVGTLDLAALDWLVWINGEVAATLRSLLLDRPVPLLPLAEAAVADGDDAHGRTSVGSRLLVERLLDGRDDAPAACADFLRRSAAFFLNPWMAASKCILNGAEGLIGSSVVTAIGGNGTDFGLQIAGLPGRWFVAPAEAPRIPNVSAEVAERALGAIGDSAVVDAVGLGAMAWRQVPETGKRLLAVMAEVGFDSPDGLLSARHPALARLPHVRVGLCARRARVMRATPIVSLGVLDRLGKWGRMDGGFYSAPLAPFVKASRALEVADGLL